MTRLLTPDEVAALCGYSRKAIYRAIERGELRATKRCSRWRLWPEDVRRWLDEGVREPQNGGPGLAVLRGYLAQNPVKAVKKPRQAARPVRPLAPETVEAIRSRLGPRDATLVSVLAYAGLRPGERSHCAGCTYASARS